MKLVLVDLVSGARFVEALAERVGTADVSVRLRRGDDRFVLTPQDDVTHLGVVSALVTYSKPRALNCQPAIPFTPKALYGLGAGYATGCGSPA